MAVTIIAQRGTHLLIADESHYAVIEQRDDRLYNCHDSRRAGVPANDLSSVGRILDDGDWSDKETAQTRFDAVVERGVQLAQRML
jgi:hypothetical protein